MGCGNSSGKNSPKTDHNRRRLSVGQADGANTDGGGAETGTAEEDRGMIQALGAEGILAMLQDSGGRKMSIGSETDAGKTSFANKATKAAGDELDLKSIGLGYTCRKGLKPEAPNQDSWFCLKMDDCSIYGVFDGHGQKGHDVSNFVKDTLPKLIIKDARFKTAEQPAMLKEAFKKCQNLVSTADRMKKLSAQMSGTTCTVCIHEHPTNALGKITIAHVADSTAVLGKVVGGKAQALQLTRDHKPNLKDERARIEKAGGRVVFDGYANHRIYAKNARYPGLNMSRCIGDLMGHADCGITAEPEVKELDIEPDFAFLLLCSDGVWEFLQATEAVELVHTNMNGNPVQAMPAAEKLAKESWDRWIREEGGAVVDDITVVLVCMNQAAS